MNYHFEDTDAVKYGVNAAIILSNIRFWIHRNSINDTNFIEERHWTYNSVVAWGELFPFFSSKQIRTAISKLIDAGVLVTGNYNRSKYDRTLWYAFADEETSLLICRQGQIEKAVKANRVVSKGQPIPDRKTDRNKDSKPKPLSSKHDSACILLNFLNDSTGRHYRETKGNIKFIVDRLKDYSEQELRTMVARKTREWKNDSDMNKYLRPATLFNATKCDQYIGECV